MFGIEVEELVHLIGYDLRLGASAQLQESLPSLQVERSACGIVETRDDVDQRRLHYG